MKSLLSLLSRITTKKYSIGSLSSIEDRAKMHLSPSDWSVLIFFGLIMTVGTLWMFAEISMALSVEVPTQGGTHIEGVVGTPRFINPLLATSETDRDITQLVFAGLLKADPDGGLSPDMATRYEISEDGLSYTFFLKENLIFHDGTPLTAEDVLFTIRAAKNPNVKSPRRANWEGVDVAVIDQHTLVFTLQAPYALFLQNTTMGILPKHLWEGVVPEEYPFSTLNTEPVGSGPYRIDGIKKNNLGIPTEYRLKAHARAAHPPYIRNFVFRFYPNQSALSRALEIGAVDAAHSILPQKETQVIHEAVFGRVFGVFFNQNQQPIFTNLEVRQALDQSIDKEEMIDIILGGYGTALSGPLPPTSVLTEETASRFNVEEARLLLERNGWEREETTGVYVRETDEGVERLSFSLTTGNAPELRAAAEYAAQSWTALGAEVEVRYFEANDLNLEVIRPRRYDALLFGLTVGAEVDLFAFWHASQRTDPGLNIGLYANIVTDALLEEAREETDHLERRKKAAEAAEEIENDVAAVFLYAPHFLYLTEKNLRGIKLTTIGAPSDRFFGVHTWHRNTERVWPLFQ